MTDSRKMIGKYKPTALLAAVAFVLAGVLPVSSQSLSESTMSLNTTHWPSVGDVRVIALEPVFEEIATLREVGISELAWAADRRYAGLTVDLESASDTFRLIEHVQLAQENSKRIAPVYDVDTVS